MKLMTETEKAYWAGFLDGEGCIRIKINQPQKPRHNAQYFLQVSITNTNPVNNDKLRNLGAYIQRHIPRNGKWRPRYQAFFQCEKAKEFLQQVYPYLRLKREEAYLAIQFQELIERQYRNLLYKKGVRGRTPFTDTEIATRKEIAEKLKKAKVW